jgi:aldehyde:ferredoxin oxidoreductase
MAQWMEWLKETEFGFLSTKPLMAIAEKFWGGRAAVDFSTAEGKAPAAGKIQDRQYVKESLILCDFLWPMIWVRFSEDHVGESTFESRIFSAVAGQEVDEEGLYRFGERIFNLQRAILIREGWGGRVGDRLPDYVHEVPLEKAFLNRECLAPGKDGETISRKGHVLEREMFEGLKDEYYELRGWDVESGLQTRMKLEALNLHDVADELEKKGLLR